MEQAEMLKAIIGMLKGNSKLQNTTGMKSLQPTNKIVRYPACIMMKV